MFEKIFGKEDLPIRDVEGTRYVDGDRRAIASLESQYEELYHSIEMIKKINSISNKKLDNEQYKDYLAYVEALRVISEKIEEIKNENHEEALKLNKNYDKLMQKREEAEVELVKLKKEIEKFEDYLNKKDVFKGGTI